jgi:hypothetical protein
MVSTKLFFHIPQSFNEKKIVDLIEVGDDSIDNYSGAELSILLEEIQRRKVSTSLSSNIKLGGSNTPQLRYSYYREQKVLEYQRFINNYFSSVNTNASQYQLDPNFYLVEDSEKSLASLSNVVKTNFVGIPSDDFNFDMIRNVANHLAKVVSYISKLRVKIKQQT